MVNPAPAAAQRALQHARACGRGGNAARCVRQGMPEPAPRAGVEAAGQACAGCGASAGTLRLSRAKPPNSTPLHTRVPASQVLKNGSAAT